jgi:hypothetical protein
MAPRAKAKIAKSALDTDSLTHTFSGRAGKNEPRKNALTPSNGARQRD